MHSDNHLRFFNLKIILGFFVLLVLFFSFCFFCFSFCFCFCLVGFFFQCGYDGFCIFLSLGLFVGFFIRLNMFAIWNFKLNTLAKFHWDCIVPALHVYQDRAFSRDFFGGVGGWEGRGVAFGGNLQFPYNDKISSSFPSSPKKKKNQFHTISSRRPTINKCTQWTRICCKQTNYRPYCTAAQLWTQFTCWISMRSQDDRKCFLSVVLCCLLSSSASCCSYFSWFYLISWQINLNWLDEEPLDVAI